MASTAVIIRSCLIDAGLVQLPVELIPASPPEAPLTPAAQTVYCFVPGMPDDYDRCVVIRDTAGRDFGREMRPPYRRHVMPGVKLIIRDLDYSAGDTLANLIATTLDQLNLTPTTLPAVDGTLTHTIQAVTRGTVNFLGEEKNKLRYLWSIDARVSFPADEPPQG